MKKSFKILTLIIFLCCSNNSISQELIEVNLDNLNNPSNTNNDEVIELTSIIYNNNAGIAYIDKQSIKFYNENNPVELVVIKLSDLPENTIITSMSNLDNAKVLEIKLDKLVSITIEHCKLIDKLPNLKFVLFTIENPNLDIKELKGFDCEKTLMQFINIARPQ